MKINEKIEINNFKHFIYKILNLIQIDRPLCIFLMMLCFDIIQLFRFSLIYKIF